MHTTVMDIGPADAAHLLAFNTNNRRINTKSVDRYATDMKNGRWRLNGISISVWEDKLGTHGPVGALHILNGQHRLLAVIQSGTTHQFLVAYEDSPDLFATYDTSGIRTTAAILEMNGVQKGYAAAAGATATNVMKYEVLTTETWQRNMFSKPEVADWVAQQDWDLMRKAILDYGALRARPEIEALGFWYASLSFMVRRDSPNADRWLEFHGAVMTGAMLDTDDARYALRKYMTAKQRTKADEWRRQADFAMGLKAWNDFVTDTPRKILTFRKDELNAKGMPPLL